MFLPCDLSPFFVLSRQHLHSSLPSPFRCQNRQCRQPWLFEQAPYRSVVVTVEVAGVLAFPFRVFRVPEAHYCGPFRIHDAVGWCYVLFVPVIVLDLAAKAVAIVGGICSLQRRSWGWAIAGAIAATGFGIWFLGAAALILTALARDEFRQPSTPGQHA
jgi:hypothetical protein